MQLRSRRRPILVLCQCYYVTVACLDLLILCMQDLPTQVTQATSVSLSVSHSFQPLIAPPRQHLCRQSHSFTVYPDPDLHSLSLQLSGCIKEHHGDSQSTLLSRTLLDGFSCQFVSSGSTKVKAREDLIHCDWSTRCTTILPLTTPHYIMVLTMRHTSTTSSTNQYLYWRPSLL